MDKGIRALAVHLFEERNPSRLAGEMTNTDFRKGICLDLEDQCGATPSSAAMAYNYAKKLFTEKHPELVEGLGRPPEKNNGGRKKKPVSSPDDGENVVDLESLILTPIFEWMAGVDADDFAVVNRDAETV